MRDVVLFDFGGTLDADGERWCVRFHAAYLEAGGRLALAAFEPVFQESDHRLASDPAVQAMGFGAMVRAQAEKLRDLLPDGAAVDLERVAERFRADTLATVTRNRPVLARLALRYRLGVVSNFTGNLDPCLAELGLSGLFSVTADSMRLGVTKPDALIYRWALDSLRAPADAAWMVGDNFEADIRPAAALGLATCWLAPTTRAAPAEGIATARVTRLTDLPTVLG